MDELKARLDWVKAEIEGLHNPERLAMKARLAHVKAIIELEQTDRCSFEQQCKKEISLNYCILCPDNQDEDQAFARFPELQGDKPDS